MLFANIRPFGGPLHLVLKTCLINAIHVDIASGYVSEDILREFKKPFADICKKRGRVRLLVGMAFWGGIKNGQLQQLLRIHQLISDAKNGSGVYVSVNRKFHGKIYQLANKRRGMQTYIGSSNFSRGGLIDNLECTVRLGDVSQQRSISQYLNFLLSPENAVAITKAEIVAPGSEEYKRRVGVDGLNDLARCDPNKIQINPSHVFKHSFGHKRPEAQSGLNAYFGEGRVSKRTGFVKPRPWFEVEIIARASEIRNTYYPKGDFTAFTDDGYVIPMKTQGSNFKNIRSRKPGGLTILGEWIKGKLQAYGALEPLEPVTEETFERYGNDTIEFYKLRDKEYFMKFLPNTNGSIKRSDEA
jgi:hypothetical protein